MKPLNKRSKVYGVYRITLTREVLKLVRLPGLKLCKEWRTKETRLKRLKKGLGVSAIIEEDYRSCERLTRYDDSDILTSKFIARAEQMFSKTAFFTH